MKNYYIIEESSDKQLWLTLWTTEDLSNARKFLVSAQSRNPYLNYRLVKTCYYQKRR